MRFGQLLDLADQRFAEARPDGLPYKTPPLAEDTTYAVVITKSVLDAGGGPSSSASFHLVSAFGQPTPIGLQSSANFVLSAGFLSPMFGESPLSPISNLVIQRMPALSMNMKLDWGAIPGANTYYIYRDTNPLFTPAPGNLVGTTPTNQFIDVNAVGLPALKYFYTITSSADGGAAASRSSS